ncbi:acyl carrier protein [Streptomyces sp. DK15]|uniref:acyl carrier protein n=1 Tax=Streptomyces sp. DK15 TaxID=2957499 RepID=UPI0029B0B751|nr:acyl carrier protein [Streptomyces sp. DK15]MDX2393583.1 acyl carrier protein [Streptomyces sp. DK15]
MAAVASEDEGVPLTEAEEELVQRAWDLIAAALERDPKDLALENRLVEDLGCDDVALANISSALEMELDVDGVYEDIEDWETVDDVLESVLYYAEADDSDADTPTTA